jgi:MFS family permease
MVLALPHLIPLPVEVRVLFVKVIGWSLHALGSAFLGLALYRFSRWAAFVASLAALLHPELAAAAVSGMEIPLAEAFIGAQLWSLIGERRLTFLVLASLTPFARPEAGILGPILGFLCAPTSTLREHLRWFGLGSLGASAGYGLMFGRNHWVSGAFMPATYSQKVATGLGAKLDSLAQGLTALLPSIIPIPLIGLVGLVIGLGWLGYHLTRQRRESRPIWAGLSGLLLLAVCSALIYPKDIPAFYHRRYLLVGLPLFLAGLSFLGESLTQRLRTPLRWILGATWIGVLLLFWPARFQHLDNDAHNIDDVQVALGRRLATLPTEANFWAVDAGAVRYFGAPFVVDTIGLNTPEISGAAGAAFLASHPAEALEVVPTWNRLVITQSNASSIHMEPFVPSTAYTVTQWKPMAVHLLLTTGRPIQGLVQVRARYYPLFFSPLPKAQIGRVSRVMAP